MTEIHQNICLASSVPCPHRIVCDVRQLCTRMHCRPLDLLGEPAPPAVHFVGFRGDEYHSAVRVFGLPDFVHRVWDNRAAQEIAPFDTAVFARYQDRPPSEFSFDDSNQPDDPAAAERLQR